MNEVIEYRPYRVHAWFVFFSLCIGIFSFIMIGCYLTDIGIALFFWIIAAIICIILSKVLYDSSNIIVFFEDKGLRISGGRYNNYRYFRWENIEYAYYSRSYKGHLFLALSPEALSSKQVKQTVNRSANLSKTCIYNVIVIYMDVTQDMSRIKELINNKVPHISGC